MPKLDTPIPERLGRYRILRRLGAGGMAEVFLAKSSGAQGIEKVLVVKRVLPSFARNPKFISMFIDEAKVAMRLNHPNIVQVYGFEQVKDEFVLAMEYVDGLDLGRLLSACRRRRRRLPWQLAAYIVTELAKGLDYAHKRKDESGEPMDIVHRDVSPQNVLISYDGVVKVADFGIARARLVSEETGVIKGKFSYMSPEQARGERVDRRSDVYSLGVLLAELLMNRPMYPGLQGMEVLERVRDGRITLPRQVDPAVPAELERIVRRATALDREERHQTARSLAGALSRYLHAQDELMDADSLEGFISEVAPRESTSPTRKKARTDPETPGPRARREIRERRNVILVWGELGGLDEEEVEEAPEAQEGQEGQEGQGESAKASRKRSAQVEKVLENIAFKYEASLDWGRRGSRGGSRRRGPRKRSFHLLIGLGRVSVDDPLHAASLALDVVEALAGLSADLVLPIEASLGICRGVVSTTRRSGRRLRYEPVDASFFEVARGLAEAAGPSEVLVSGEVERLARRAFSFEEESAGLGQPGGLGLKAYRLRGARTREERRAEANLLSGQVGLFGRSQEIRALTEIYEEVVATKKSAYVVVTGDLGVGKTALVGAALGRFTPDPRLLRIECLFGHSEEPYSAVAELIREACGIDDELPPEEVQKKLRRVLKRALRDPQWRASVLRALEPLIVAGVKYRDEEGDRARHITNAVRLLLGGLASQGPLVVWVDAAQLADAPSSELVARLLRQQYDVPLMVILCSRPNTRVDDLARAVPRIKLEELGEEERRGLIRAVLGDAAVPEPIAQAIVHRAGGNPFFLIELIDGLLDRGAIEIKGEGEDRRVERRGGAAFALPATLEDVIASRLSELPDPERHALRWLAVAGPGFRAAELEQISGESLVEELTALAERGLLQSRAGGGLHFPSAVVRHVAYESAEQEDRARMHAQIAAYLSGLPMTPPPARVAYHLEQAGDHEAAGAAYVAAGALARSMYSYQEALRFYGRSIRLLPEGSPHIFPAYAGREQLLRSMGRRAEQRQDLAVMRRIAESGRDPARVAVAFNRMARFDLDANRSAGVEAMLRRALDAAFAAGDTPAEIESLRLLGQLRRDQGDVNGALEALDRALASAGGGAEHLSARGQVLAQKGILLWRAGRIGDSLAALGEAIVIFRRLGRKSDEAQALSQLGVALVLGGSFEDAINVIRASIVLDRELGDRLHLGRKVSNVGQAYGELGDAERAMAFLERALDLFEVLDDQSGQADTLCAMTIVLTELVGDLEQASRTLREARILAERIGDPYDKAHVGVAEASLALALDDPERAAAAAESARGYARTAGAASYEVLGEALGAEALARAGRFEEACHLAEGAQRRVGTQEGVERVASIYLRVARAFELSRDRDRASGAVREARKVLDRRLGAVRDERLRRSYLSSPTVRKILGMAAELDPEPLPDPPPGDLR